MELSFSQKIAKFFSSEKKFEEMKKESMLWQFTCESCKQVSNIWEIGGIRYKAAGKPSVMIKCPKCGKVAMQKLHKNSQ